MSERLSIVVPVYNEAAVIEEVLEELARDVLVRLGDGEMIVVDDCSTDATGKILDALADSNPRIRVEHSEVNRGHGPSLRRAIELSSGDWIFHVDSDGQFVAEEFWRLWERRDRADLVLGVRRTRRDPRHRILLTKLIRAVVSALALRVVRDPNVPFKLFRRELWDELRPFVGEDALAPSIMISMGAAVRRRRLEDVEVTHLPRRYGVSTLRFWRLVKFSLRGLMQLLVFRYRLARAPAYARL